MKIIKPLTLGLLHKPYQYQGKSFIAITAMGFFKLGQGNARFLLESAQWPKIVPRLPQGVALDEVMPKPQGEVLLLANAYAPKGAPSTEMEIRVRLANVDKRLRIYGDREWKRGVYLWSSVSKTAAITVQKIDYAYAFGGAKYAQNPVGRGYTGKLSQNHGQLPNISYPTQNTQARWLSAQPAGYSPIPISHPLRSSKLGSYGRRWRKYEAPGFASNLNWEAFMQAPIDQWITGYFQGGEDYCLEGMHPTQSCLKGRIPALKARAFILSKNQKPEDARELHMRFDTVYFLPDQELGVALFHGHVEIKDSDGLDVQAIMLAYENNAEDKSKAHYLEVLNLRLDPKTAALHAFNESQLAATLSPEAQAEKQMLSAENSAKEQKKRQAAINELHEDFWQSQGSAITRPKADVPPTATTPPFASLNSQSIVDGDFDLSKIIAEATQIAEQAERAGQAKIAQLAMELGAAPSADQDRLYQEAIERAIVPAYDLFPENETGVDPQQAEMLLALETAYQNGQGDPHLSLAEAQTHLKKLPALKRQARRAAITATQNQASLSPEKAQKFGQVVMQWLRSGLSLAGRDLSGVDLRGCDLSGADLREVMLENALLDGANFSDANLQGAVLLQAHMQAANFSRALLTDANLCQSLALHANFYAAQLKGARAIEAKWDGAQLDQACLDDFIGIKIQLNQASLREVQAKNAIFLQAEAVASRWHGAQLEKMVALRADLSHCEMVDVRMNKTVLIEANLSSSRWLRASLNGVQATSKANWRDAEFEQVSAENCGFHGIDFQEVRMHQSRFIRCDFGECNMEAAHITESNFAYSTFMQTRLNSASITNVDFYQANCRKADFRDGRISKSPFFQTELTQAQFGPDLSKKHSRDSRRAA